MLPSRVDSSTPSPTEIESVTLNVRQIIAVCVIRTNLAHAAAAHPDVGCGGLSGNESAQWSPGASPAGKWGGAERHFLSRRASVMSDPFGDSQVRVNNLPTADNSAERREVKMATVESRVERPLHHEATA